MKLFLFHFLWNLLSKIVNWNLNVNAIRIDYFAFIGVFDDVEIHRLVVFIIIIDRNRWYIFSTCESDSTIVVASCDTTLDRYWSKLARKHVDGRRLGMTETTLT